MPKQRKRWAGLADNDPLAGLINLFDLWMVFAIALLLALVGNLQQSGRVFGDANQQQRAGDATAQELDRINPSAKPLERYRPSNEELTGEGERLGTAYRLKSGEVVYVPETKESK